MIVVGLIGIIILKNNIIFLNEETNEILGKVIKHGDITKRLKSK